MRKLVRVALVLVLALTFIPPASAEEVNVGNGLLVVTVDESTEDGYPWVHSGVRSDLVGTRYGFVTGCSPDLYASRCHAEEQGADASPSPGVRAGHKYSDPKACAFVSSRVDPKQENAASACVPGRAFPLPWGQCARVDVYAPTVVDTTSERCLLP